MCTNAIPDPSTKLAQDAVLRAADLSELLGHLDTRWDDERRALSRQLHDGQGASLSALTMHLSLLVRQLPQESALLERAAQMKRLLLDVVASNREMQQKLWNDKLEFLGVTVALADLATEFGVRHRIAVRCSMPEHEMAWPRSHGVALLHTLEEALRNIAAHAQASEVDVSLDANDEVLVLIVKDNGIGLSNGDGAQPSKHGLRAIRERVHYLGGRLTLAGQHGTTLTVSLPVAK